MQPDLQPGLVIFDCDGVLVDSERLAIKVDVKVLAHLDKMKYTLGLTGLYDRFAGRIFSATEVPRGKPEPDLFLHAATRMGVAPSACVVVEDSVSGVAAARAAGMRVLAYGGGVTSAARLEGPSTTVFGSMSDLPALVSRQPGFQA